MNKDWPGRAYYVEAYIAAIFATRQWVDIVRRGVGDPDFWEQGARLPTAERQGRKALAFDVHQGARGALVLDGPLAGSGRAVRRDNPGPGGSLDDTFFAAEIYFARARSLYRSLYERVVPTVRRRRRHRSRAQGSLDAAASAEDEVRPRADHRA